VTVSEEHRRRLAEYAERLYQSGINWIPMKFDNTPVTFYPKRNMRIVYGPLYMKRMDEETHRLFKEMVLELPYVSGISVVSRVGGLLVVDFDAAKNSKRYGLEEKINKLIRDYGSFVYIDRRMSQKHNSIVPRGLKIGLFIDQSILSSKDIVYVHNYEEEVGDRSPPPKTIYPSLRIDPQTREKSAYVKLSSVDLWESYYDKDFKLLPEVMERLSVKVELRTIDEIQRARATTNTSNIVSSSSGKPILGLEPTTKIDSFEKMLTLLKEVGKLIDCPGFLVFLEHLEQGNWIIPYEVIPFGPGKTYQRSSWSIAENHIMRALAEFGVPKDLFTRAFLPRMENIQREVCQQYQHGCSHRTESRDVSTAFRFTEFGHEPGGKCIYLRYGICPREECLNTVYGKLNLLSRSQAYAIRERILLMM